MITTLRHIGSWVVLAARALSACVNRGTMNN
jgi:hypothetical protein